MSSFRSPPPFDPPPTLITFGVVTLAIALVSLITLTLAAAVTLATLTRPRGLVSGRSIRTPPIRGHNIIEIYGLSVPPMPPLSLGETMAILMEKQPKPQEGPACCACVDQLDLPVSGPTLEPPFQPKLGVQVLGPSWGHFRQTSQRVFLLKTPKKGSCRFRDVLVKYVLVKKILWLVLEKLISGNSILVKC